MPDPCGDAGWPCRSCAPVIVAQIQLCDGLVLLQALGKACHASTADLAIVQDEGGDSLVALECLAKRQSSVVANFLWQMLKETCSDVPRNNLFLSVWPQAQQQLAEKKVVIKLDAFADSPRGGCTSSRLDHSLKNPYMKRQKIGFPFTRVRALRTKTHIFSNIWPLAGPNIGFIPVWGGRCCLKPTGEKAGIGLRRENCGFPESRKSKP